MNRSLSSLLAMVTLVVVALAAAAQEPGPPPPPSSGPGHMMEMHGPGEPGEGKTVTGIPLTAQIVVTHENTLADGNRISRTSQTTLYRDSQGRTRREVTIDAGTPAMASVKHSMIMIHDPVAGKRYMLDPANKTAREMGGPHGPGDHPKHPGGDAVKEMLSKNVQRDQLGKKTIDGYEASGEKVTRTIAAGEIGNEKPIEVVSERWFSAELQLPVLLVHTDPMMGTATTKVISVTRGEPDASLFQVPSDYKIVSGRHDEPFYVPIHP